MIYIPATWAAQVFDLARSSPRKTLRASATEAALPALAHTSPSRLQGEPWYDLYQVCKFRVHPWTVGLLTGSKQMQPRTKAYWEKGRCTLLLDDRMGNRQLGLTNNPD